MGRERPLRGRPEPRVRKGVLREIEDEILGRRYRRQVALLATAHGTRWQAQEFFNHFDLACRVAGWSSRYRAVQANVPPVTSSRLRARVRMWADHVTPRPHQLPVRPSSWFWNAGLRAELPRVGVAASRAGVATRDAAYPRPACTELQPFRGTLRQGTDPAGPRRRKGNSGAAGP